MIILFANIYKEQKTSRCHDEKKVPIKLRFFFLYFKNTTLVLENLKTSVWAIFLSGKHFWTKYFKLGKFDEVGKTLCKSSYTSG